MKQYIVEKKYGFDGEIYFFDKFAAARNFAKKEKAEDKSGYDDIILARCDTCELNIDGEVGFETYENGFKKCDYSKIYKF